MTTGQDVALEARKWIGTPFAHQHRAKGRACDCAGLVIGVARSLGLVAVDFDVTGYPRQADGITLVRICDQFMTRIPMDTRQVGDVVAIAFGAVEHHLAILADYRFGGLSLVHAWIGCKPARVVEHRLMTQHMNLTVAYRMPGVA